MLKAIILDFDGTIADTLPLSVESIRRTAEPILGKALPDDDIRATFGPSEEGSIRALCPENRVPEALEAQFQHYKELHKAYCAAPFPGMKKLIEWLRSKGIIVAVVTGKGAGNFGISMELFGTAELFDLVETGHPTKVIKVEAITRVMRHFGLAADECLYVGDAASDIANARLAGVKAVGAAWAPDTDADALRRENPYQLFFTVDDFRGFLERAIQN